MWILLDLLSSVGRSCRRIKRFLLSPDSSETVTFNDFRNMARRISDLLVSAGMAKGEKIGFLLDNGTYTASLFLGIMYGGFVAVPLNPISGKSQIAQTIVDSGYGSDFREQDL